MKTRRGHLLDWLIQSFFSRQDPSAAPDWLARLLASLNFVVVIIFLAAWITVFLVLKQYLSTTALPQNVITDLACLSFFGGMIIAFLIAGIAGNLLRRFF